MAFVNKHLSIIYIKDLFGDKLNILVLGKKEVVRVIFLL